MDPSAINLPTYIETKRLYLRPYIETDAESLFKLQQASIDSLNRWQLGTLAMRSSTLDDINTYIKTAQKEKNDKSKIKYGSFDKASNNLIGEVTLLNFEWDIPKGCIGYLTHKECSGLGYATEAATIGTRLAFDYLNLIRLELRVATDNKASKAIARKLGYKHQGTFNKYKKSVDGVLWDMEIYAKFDSLGLPKIHIEWQ